MPLGAWLDALSLPGFFEVEVDVVVPRDLRFRSPVSAVVRGLLGERLRARSCLTATPTCDGCTVRSLCDYARLFAADAGPRPAQGGLADLHPFWLQGLPAVHSLDAGSAGAVSLVAVGLEAREQHLLHLCLREALSHLGLSHVSGDHRATLQLSPSRCQVVSPDLTPSSATTWWIEARTPLLLSVPRNGAYLSPCPAAPWLPLLVAAGIRRLKALAQSFAGLATFPEVELPALDAVRVVAGRMQPWRGEVRSSRQGRAYPLENAYTGAALLQGEALAAVGPLLQLLQHTNVGKKTSMGFGDLFVEGRNSPEDFR